MPDIDLFRFFRWWLGWIVTIYATVVMMQSLWGWYVWLRGRDQYLSMLRRYILIHGLRLRFRTFWGDLLICLLLMVAFALMWRAQIVADDIEAKVSNVQSHTRQQ